MPHQADPEKANNSQPSPPQPKHLAPKIVAFEDLCQCGDEIWITLGGQLYRLRKTRQGKLILTK